MKLGDARLVMAFGTIGVSGVLAVVVGGVVFGGAVALSVGVGAVLALANLYVLSRIVGVYAVPFEDAATHAGFAWGVIALGKILLLFGGVWLLMSYRIVSPIALVVGYGSLPIGIAIGAIVSDKKGPPSGA